MSQFNIYSFLFTFLAISTSAIRVAYACEAQEGFCPVRQLAWTDGFTDGANFEWHMDPDCESVVDDGLYQAYVRQAVNSDCTSFLPEPLCSTYVTDPSVPFSCRGLPPSSLFQTVIKAPDCNAVTMTFYTPGDCQVSTVALDCVGRTVNFACASGAVVNLEVWKKSPQGPRSLVASFYNVTSEFVLPSSVPDLTVGDMVVVTGSSVSGTGLIKKALCTPTPSPSPSPTPTPTVGLPGLPTGSLAPTITTTCGSAALQMVRIKCGTSAVYATWTVSAVAGASTGVISAPVSSSDLASFSSLASSTVYTFQAVACCPDGLTVPSCLTTPVTGSFRTASPATTPSVTVATLTTTNLTLTYTSTCADGSQPTYSVKLVGPTGQVVAPATAPATWRGLRDGTPYTYSVTASCTGAGADCSATATQQVVTRNVPTEPVQPSTTCFGATRLCLQWLPPVDAVCSAGASLVYEYTLSTGLNCSNTRTIVKSSSTTSVGPNALADLSVNTQYAWRVRACCGSDGCSNWTACVPAKTTNLGPGSGTLTGDPHGKAFDGVRYDLKRCGDYLIERALDNSWALQGRFTIRGWSFAVTGALAVKCGTTTFSVYHTSAGQLFTYWNEGTAVDLNISSTAVISNGYVQVTRFAVKSYSVKCSNAPGFEVKIYGQASGTWYYLDYNLALTPRWDSLVEGLLGRYNGDNSDDLVYGPSVANKTLIGTRWPVPVGYNTHGATSINVAAVPSLQLWHDSWYVSPTNSFFKKDLCKYDVTCKCGQACAAGDWTRPARRLLEDTPQVTDEVLPLPDYTAWVQACLAAVPDLGADAADQCGYDAFLQAEALAAVPTGPGVSGRRLLAIPQLAVQIRSLAANYYKVTADSVSIDGVSEGTTARRNLLSADKKGRTTRVKRTARTVLTVAGRFNGKVDKVLAGSLQGPQTELKVLWADKKTIQVATSPLAACGSADVHVRLVNGKTATAMGVLNVACPEIKSVKVNKHSRSVVLQVTGTLGNDIFKAEFGKFRGTVLRQTKTTAEIELSTQVLGLTRSLMLTSRSLGAMKFDRVKIPK